MLSFLLHHFSWQMRHGPIFFKIFLIVMEYFSPNVWSHMFFQSFLHFSGIVLFLSPKFKCSLSTFLLQFLLTTLLVVRSGFPYSCFYLCRCVILLCMHLKTLLGLYNVSPLFALVFCTSCLTITQAYVFRHQLFYFLQGLSERIANKMKWRSGDVYSYHGNTYLSLYL